MKVLTNYEELEGKTIAFAHMAQFAEQITLGTTDGCVLMVSFDMMDEFGGDKQIDVFNQYRVMNTINAPNQAFVRNELANRGIFDIAEYEKNERLKREREKQKRAKEQEERELKELDRLMKKYGHK